MIKGIGTDICDLDRLHIHNEKFIQKVLHDQEQKIFYQKHSDQAKREFLGGRFAVKEAFIKAYGPVPYQNIICLNDENGKPYLNYDKCHVSISHEHHYAIAFVIVEV